MPFIGNQPAESYSAFQKQDFTTSATTSYTLDHPVANQNEIALFINFVRQEPTTAYTASGTSLSLTSATSVGDDMYCVYLGKAVQTVNPPSGSVGTSQLVDGSITSAKLASGVGGVAGITSSADATAITIDSSENVGIGISPTPPTAYGGLHIHSTYPVMKLSSTATGSGTGDGFVARIDSTPRVELWNFENSNMVFATNNTEQMRLDTSGTLNLLKTNFNAAASSSNRGLEIRANGSGALTLDLNVTDTGTATIMEFNNGNGNAGTIQTSGSSTSYNTSSDYRLKENVNYDFDATSRLKELKPARFNFKTDADTTVDGFLAHEVQTVVPEAISGTHNETETKQKVVINSNNQIIAEDIEQTDWETGKIADENGNTQYPTDSTWEATKVVPIYQGIDQAKLVPLLVKTIQELEARITELENA